MLIDSDTTLRRFLPNAFSTTDGETSLYDKLAPYLNDAEAWMVTNFLSWDIYNFICNLSWNEAAGKSQIAKTLVEEALINAIPSLDLVLTPNGFGVVSNANIAPASKDRVERLLASLEMSRDQNIDSNLRLMVELTDWLTTPQANYFAATLFPDLSLCDHLGITEHRWAQYQEKRAQLITIEDQLANEYISPELYAAFRQEALNQFPNTPTARRFLIQTLRFHEVAILQGRTPHPQALADIVNIIRSTPDIYPEWQNTPTAALFSPNKFENTKQSGGFWF